MKIRYYEDQYNQQLRLKRKKKFHRAMRKVPFWIVIGLILATFLVLFFG